MNAISKILHIIVIIVVVMMLVVCAPVIFFKRSILEKITTLSDNMHMWVCNYTRIYTNNIGGVFGSSQEEPTDLNDFDF